MIVRTAGLSLVVMLSGPAAAEDGAALFEPCRACHSLDPAAKVMAARTLQASSAAGSQAIPTSIIHRC